MTLRERPLVGVSGGVKEKNVCTPMALSMRLRKLEPITEDEEKIVRAYIIPGLDAERCKCPVCLELHPEGVWWVYENVRDEIRVDKKNRMAAASVQI